MAHCDAKEETAIMRYVTELATNIAIHLPLWSGVYIKAKRAGAVVSEAVHDLRNVLEQNASCNARRKDL